MTSHQTAHTDKRWRVHSKVQTCFFKSSQKFKHVFICCLWPALFQLCLHIKLYTKTNVQILNFKVWTLPVCGQHSEKPCLHIKTANKLKAFKRLLVQFEHCMCVVNILKRHVFTSKLQKLTSKLWTCWPVACTWPKFWTATTSCKWFNCKH
jgi:hypothetical protein